MSIPQTRNVEPNTTSDALQPVPLFDNRRQFRELETELLAAVTRVSQSGQYVMGPDCQQLEQRLAEFCRVPHALGCASGSDALLLALMALDVGPGDEVILPSYTFFATASCVSRLGAKPVFVDIDPESFNLDPRAIEPAITSNTKAIIPVHLYGQCADITAIANVARPRSLPVIEDACQAIGAELYGRRAGELGDMGCFSFYPTKNLGCFGDGGLITTVDGKLAERLKLLRAHGMQPRYYHQVIGINSRLDSIQAAVLNVKLGYLDAWTMARAERAHQYVELCRDVGLDRIVSLPIVQPGRRHVWNQYVIRVPDGRRDELRAYLSDRKIGTEIYYPVPLHRQQCYADLGYAEGSLPETERAARETLALPIFPELTVSEQQRVVDEMANFFGCRRTATVGKPHFFAMASRAEIRTAP